MSDDTPWTCAICGQRYVVPTLARLCEERHAGRDLATEEPPCESS